MSINYTSQDKVNNFFKYLENFKSHNIFIHTDKDTSLKHAKNADRRMKKLSEIDGELFAVKANIKVNSLLSMHFFQQWKWDKNPATTLSYRDHFPASALNSVKL